MCLSQSWLGRNLDLSGPPDVQLMEITLRFASLINFCIEAQKSYELKSSGVPQ